MAGKIGCRSARFHPASIEQVGQLDTGRVKYKGAIANEPRGDPVHLVAGMVKDSPGFGAHDQVVAHRAMRKAAKASLDRCDAMDVMRGRADALMP